MAIPFATWAFGGVSALLLVRGLWNPHRALLRSAAVQSCPGPDGSVCRDTIALVAQEGVPVYAAAAGTVIALGDNWMHIQVSNEPVVLAYYGLTPDVEVGQNVGRGRKIGGARANEPLEFGVTEIMNQNGSATMVALEPRSWLAARGVRLTVNKTPDTQLWCGPGRHITVPQAVHQGCGLQMPERSNFALLPVSITEA